MLLSSTHLQGLGVPELQRSQSRHRRTRHLPPEFMALRALPHLQEMTERANVPLLGIIPTMTTTTTRHAREVMDQLTDQYSDLLLPAIPRRVALQDAALAGLPVTSFEPSSEIAERFMPLAREVLTRGKNLAA